MSSFVFKLESIHVTFFVDDSIQGGISFTVRLPFVPTRLLNHIKANHDRLMNRIYTALK